MDFVSYGDDGYGHMGGVELISVGMDWPASTGDYTATFDQLADIVTAANEDPLVLPPRIKLGHTSEVNGELLVINPLADVGDAAPAFGRIINLRLDGAVLRGDFVEVPVWLADAMPSAYPSRSAEPWLGYETPGGKRYAAVLVAVSLLGEYMPAIQDLEDLQRLMEGGPEAVAATREEAPDVPLRRPRANREQAPELSVDAGAVADYFNFEWAVDPENIFEIDGETYDPYWWWVRSVRVDPLEIIVEGDRGDLWRFPFSTDGRREITIDTPQRVIEVYEPVNASAEEATRDRIVPVRDGQRVLASALARPEKPDKPTAAAAAADPQEATVPIDMDALRRRLELPDDATEEQINEALAAETETEGEAGTETGAETGAETSETAEAPAAEGSETAAETPEPEPVAASDGTVRVDREQWQTTRAQAAEGATVAQQTREQEEQAALNSAIQEGRIPPSRREHYEQLMATDREGTLTLLTASVDEGGLAPGLVPVSERGATETETGGDAQHQRIMAGAFGIDVTKGA